MESPPMMEQRGNSDMQQPCKNLHRDLYRLAKRFEGEEVVNLMISRSLDTIVQSLDELVSVLRDYGERVRSWNSRPKYSALPLG